MGDRGFKPGVVLDGRYRVDAIIGRGGFGTVFRASQLPLDRQVAIKLLSPDVPHEWRARFEREARLVQRLEHPHTVRLLDFGVLPTGEPFIVMELLRGRSLEEWLRDEGPLDARRAALVAQQILKALMEAHALGIVHRDIKPANIFLGSHAGEELFAKLLDFGIAKQLVDGESATESPESARATSALANLPPPALARATQALTRASRALGTPRYMAPEQLAGDPIGPVTDIYALGLTLAEMIEGAPVFGGEDVLALCEQQISDAPVPLSDRVRASILGAVIERATEKRETDRFSSARDMLDAITATSAEMRVGGPSASASTERTPSTSSPSAPSAGSPSASSPSSPSAPSAGSPSAPSAGSPSAPSPGSPSAASSRPRTPSDVDPSAPTELVRTAAPPGAAAVGAATTIEPRPSGRASPLYAGVALVVGLAAVGAYVYVSKGGSPAAQGSAAAPGPSVSPDARAPEPAPTVASQAPAPSKLDVAASVAASTTASAVASTAASAVASAGAPRPAASGTLLANCSGEAFVDDQPARRGPFSRTISAGSHYVYCKCDNGRNIGERVTVPPNGTGASRPYCDE